MWYIKTYNGHTIEITDAEFYAGKVTRDNITWVRPFKGFAIYGPGWWPGRWIEN